MDFEEIEDEWSDAYHDVLNTLYSAATPGLDYESLDPGDLVDEEPPTYLRHYLDADTQEELIEDVLDDYEIPESLYFEAKKSVLLSAGPSTSIENVDRAREEAGLQPVSDILEENGGNRNE